MVNWRGTFVEVPREDGDGYEELEVFENRPLKLSELGYWG